MYVFNTRAPYGVHVQGSVCIAQRARIITHLLHRVNGVIDRLRQVTLDLDSTVLTVYGKQEGARLGYNPHKRGKRSYHPLLCFIAETEDYLYGKLRKGDAASAMGLLPFFKKCLNRLPETVQRIRVRADAGFYSGGFFDLLEARDIEYAVAARVTRRLGRRLRAVSYRPVAADIEVGELNYQAIGWGEARRMAVIRKKLPERPDPQMPLFTLERYSYQVIATNVADMAPEEVWEFYNGRAVVENRIEEVKNQFNLSKIPSSDYMAHACYFQMVVLNLTRAFPRQEMFESVLGRVREMSLQFG